MSISMLAAIVAKQDELCKKPANIAAMMKWSDNPAVREWGLRLENALLREKTEAVTPCNQLVTRKAMEEIKAIIKVWNRALVSTKKTIETIEEIATQVLNTPPRNCDRQYKNDYDVLGEFTAKTGRQIFETVDVVNWLFAEAKKECEEKE